MKRAAALALIATYLIIASVPLWSRLVGLREQHVAGVFEKKPLVRPTVNAVLHERFQRDFTTWFERNRGLVGHAMHIDNSVLYHVFGETRIGARVRLGRDGVLFIDEDIDSFNRPPEQMPSAADIDAVAVTIAEVQRRLAAGGRAMVPIIIPNKAWLYVDKVDRRWQRSFPGPRPSDQLHQQMVAALTLHGVRFVDMRADFAHATVPRRQLWVEEARHWSQFGACLANRQIVAVAATLVDLPPIPYACALVEDRVGRTHDDFDLWRLLNTWKVQRVARTAPRGDHTVPTAPVTPWRILYVGTSFNWALIRDAVSSHVLGPVHMHYYEQQVISWPDGAAIKMAAVDPAWATLVAGKDVIVLDMLDPFVGHTYMDNVRRAALQVAPTLPPAR
jgi:SGNH hydrolase-like domain, acetyltransferase AlgX